MNITGPLTVGDHTGGAGTVNGQDAYTGQLVVREIQTSTKTNGLRDVDHGGVAPTLNAFDNATESRATVIAFSHYSSDASPSDEIVPTLRAGTNVTGHAVSITQEEETQPVIAFYSTGGGNDAPAEEISPALKVGSSLDIASPPAVAIPIQDGRDIDKKQNGLGVGDEGDPSYTLDQTGGQAVAFNLHSGSKRADRPEGGMYVNETEIAQTLDTAGGLEPTKNDGGVAIVASTVRRLTPVECERLQGFPDNWTAERYDYKKQEVVPQADSARYKQMGNAVAVPVFEWVISRLVAVDVALNQTQEQGGAA